MTKKYPKPFETPCPMSQTCPFRSKNPREKVYVQRYPRLYGRRARCHYVNVFKCPYEVRYPSARRYDEKYPYPYMGTSRNG